MSSCTRCETLIEEGDLRCSVCALPIPTHVAGPEKARSQILRCTECGAAVGFDANHQAPACGFCRAVMTIEQPIDPVEVASLRVLFAVDRESAVEALRSWLGNRGWFAPKTLRDEAVIETLQPLCWAAWSVDASAQVAWTADSDEGAHRSDWAPHAGQLAITLDRIIVPASRGLRADECAQLVPYYDLSRVVAIAADPELPEMPERIESFDAQRSAARRQIHDALEGVAKMRVRSVIPGRRFRNIHISCLLEQQTTDRVALPAWVLAYRYRGTPYRAIVHGQQRQIVVGSSPVDRRKVAMLVLALAAAILAIVTILVWR